MLLESLQRRGTNVCPVQLKSLSTAAPHDSTGLYMYFRNVVTNVKLQQ